MRAPGEGPAGAPGFGLALGGGSFRGLAHVGVLEVLDHEGLRPSWVTGTSAGAIAAALLAFGVSPTEMHEAVESVGWGTIARVRPLVPIGTLTNEGLGAALVRTLGDARIESSDIPLQVVATDISTGERVLLDQGPVAPAVMASSCVPGLFMPVEIDGRLLVDGALVENVPVRAAREFRDGVVVAVSLGLDLPFTRLRNAAQVLVNAFEIAVDAQTRRQLQTADVAIEPDLRRFNKLLPAHLEDIVEVGRRSAEEAVPRIREALRIALDGRAALET